MQEISKGWNHRIRLAMGELEDKIQRESVHNKRRESWPGQEQVDAWTAERQQQRSSGQYCGSTAQEIPVTKEEKKRQGFVKSVCMQVVKSAAFALATIALIQGVSRHLPDSITVSSSVGGRELPIYCVETDKKQVALSFDAAWGNDILMEWDFRGNCMGTDVHEKGDGVMPPVNSEPFSQGHRQYWPGAVLYSLVYRRRLN